MRFRSAFSFALRAVLGGIALYTVPWLIGAARAATGDAPVPPPTPDALMSYVQNYGPIVGGLTVIYLGLRWLLRKNEGTHWLAQGRTLAVVTTLVGVGGTALQAYTTGTPWSGVLVTAVLGLLHLADAQVTPATVPQKGSAQLGLLVAMAMIGLATVAASGCAASQRSDTIRAALVTVDSARDGFLAYDRAHEMSLTAHCDPAMETKEQCAAKVTASNAALAAYQAKRAKVDPVFTGAYHAIAAAELLNTDQSLVSMQTALAQAIEVVKAFMGGK